MKQYSVSKVFSLFKKFGGFRLFRAYVKLGVFSRVCLEIIKGILQHQSIDKIYYRYQPYIVKALRAKYRNLMAERLNEHERKHLDNKLSDVVWCCWLQGFDNAPPIVKACHQSLRKHIKNKEIRIVDEANRSEYIQLPDFIEQRWKKGQIPPAMFADLIRLELLIKYGGSWIDATVLCTSDDYPKEYLDANLFFFQYSRKELDRFSGISNWFITSCSNHPVLITLRDMLYVYWKDFDCVLEYFIFHRFIEMIFHLRPVVVKEMPYGFSPDCHILVHHWTEKFDRQKWDKLTGRICFHKLAHQIDERIYKDKNNYFNHIISEMYEK